MRVAPETIPETGHTCAWVSPRRAGIVRARVRKEDATAPAQAPQRDFDKKNHPGTVHGNFRAPGIRVPAILIAHAVEWQLRRRRQRTVTPHGPGAYACTHIRTGNGAGACSWPMPPLPRALAGSYRVAMPGAVTVCLIVYNGKSGSDFNSPTHLVENEFGLISSTSIIPPCTVAC